MTSADVRRRCRGRTQNDTCHELTQCAGREEECTFTGCCAGQLRCLERDAYFAQCLRHCPQSKAWTCIERQAARPDAPIIPHDVSKIVLDMIENSFGQDKKVKLLAYGHVVGFGGAIGCLILACFLRCIVKARARAKRHWHLVEAIRNAGSLADEIKANPAVASRRSMQKAASKAGAARVSQTCLPTEFEDDSSSVTPNGEADNSDDDSATLDREAGHSDEEDDESKNALHG